MEERVPQGKRHFGPVRILFLHGWQSTPGGYVEKPEAIRGRLFIRGADGIYCYDLRAGGK